MDPRHSDQKVEKQGNPDGKGPLEPPQLRGMHLGDTGVHAPAISPSLLEVSAYVFYVFGIYVCCCDMHVLVEEHSGTNVLKGGRM